MKKSLIAMLVFCVMIGGIITYNNSQTMDLGDGDVPLGPGFVLDARSQQLLDDLTKVESMVAQLAETDDIEVINNGSLGFVRSKKYGYRTDGMSRFIWDGYGGTIIGETGIDVGLNAGKVSEILDMTDQMTYINDPFVGDPIDFPHMVAVIDVAYTNKDNEEDYLEAYNDFLLTWGGDLETFLLNMNDYSDSSGKVDYDSMYVFASETLASEDQSYFSLEDYNADLDGVNIEALMREEGLLLSEAIERYYTTGMFMEREGLFVEAHGGQAAMEAAVRGFILGEVPESYKEDAAFIEALDGVRSFNELMRNMVYEQNYDPTEATREAAADVFLEKVLQNGYVASKP